MKNKHFSSSLTASVPQREHRSHGRHVLAWWWSPHPPNFTDIKRTHRSEDRHLSFDVQRDRKVSPALISQLGGAAVKIKTLVFRYWMANAYTKLVFLCPPFSLSSAASI